MTQAQKKLFGRDFTLMVAGQIISLFGNAALRFALSMAVLDLTGSAALFGVISAISMVPTVLFSPFGGILADRVSKSGLWRRWILPRRALLASVCAGVGGKGSGSGHSGHAGGAFRDSVLLPALGAVQHSAVGGGGTSDGGKRRYGAGERAFKSARPHSGRPFYGFFGIAPILYVSVICFFSPR